MITIVLTYFNSGQMLEKHLDEWSHYAPDIKQNFGAIIVDDGSPDNPAIDHMKDPGFPVKLWRIKQNIPWNVAGARNLGMHEAPEGPCLLSDIDHLLRKEDAGRLVDALDNPTPEINRSRKSFYIFKRKWADGRPLHPHPNSYVLDRSLYWECGGTDEDWSGWWGAGEQVFRKNLFNIADQIEFRSIYLTHYGRDDISDASTREWGRKNSPWDWRKNPKLVEKAKKAPYKPENPLRFDWEKVYES